MAESDYTYVAERECPVCNKKIKVTMVRTRLIKTKQDSDFCTYYKDINPYYYSIWVCEHCGYAAQDTYFESINERDKKVIAEFLKSREVSIKIDLKRSREQALVAFKLAIYYADLLGMPASKMGGLYLKLAWIYRADKMDIDEKKVLLRALGYYEKALISERFPIGNMTDTFLMYLIGALYQRIGNYDQAVSYLSKVVSSERSKMEPNILKMARDLWQDIRELRRLEAEGQTTDETTDKII